MKLSFYDFWQIGLVVLKSLLLQGKEGVSHHKSVQFLEGKKNQNIIFFQALVQIVNKFHC